MSEKEDFGQAGGVVPLLSSLFEGATPLELLSQGSTQSLETGGVRRVDPNIKSLLRTSWNTKTIAEHIDLSLLLLNKYFTQLKMHQQSAPGDRPSIDPPQNKPADQWPKSKEVENIGTDSMTDEEGGELKMTWRTWLAMLSFQLGYMSDVFVLSMASSVLGEINRDIGPSDSYAWMAAAQTLGAAVMSPSVGRLSDIFGRRNFLLIGNVIGAVGCAVAATAKNVNTVIGASVIIGIGSAMHQLAWSCLAELVPKNKRSLALGVFQTTLTPSSVFAPVVGMSSSSIHFASRESSDRCVPFSLQLRY